MSKKIKVLRIIARLNIGGPAIHTILLSEGLNKDKFETILVTGQAESFEGDMLYLAEQKGIRPVIIPELGRSLNIRRDFITFRKLLGVIKRERPDIIHTHTAKAGTLGRLAGIVHNLNSGGKKCILIHTFHGHVLHSYFGRIKSIFFVWVERVLALFTSRIITLSENLKNEIMALKIGGPDKIVTIPLGLELDKYLTIENNSAENKDHKSIGIIGRLVPIKNHKMFLDAAKQLSGNLPFGQRAKFLIVGDGPLRKDLEKYAEELGIAEDVTFAGWIKDLERVYSKLDIVALTSLNEGTPVALIEAQAAARPCVATNVGGVADLVEHGKNGFLVPFQRTEGLVQALIKLLSDPELMKTMGTCGRAKVRDKFSKQRLLRDIEKLYQEVKV